MLEFLNYIPDVIGMTGVFLLIIAYFLLSTNRMSSQSLKYQLLNLIGAIFILFSLFFNFNLSSFAIEMIWIIISLIGIYKITRDKKIKVKINSVTNVYHFERKKKL
jgi:predicted membrane protein